MLGCEILFGDEQGAKMQELVERVTGEPCPCKQGKGCPLMPPAQSASPELESLPDPLHRLP